MFKSLTVKLILAFLAVSLIGVALVAVFSQLITEREFDRFRQEQAQNDFIAEATAYYQAHGSWQGIDKAMNQPGSLSSPQGQPNGGPPLPQGQPNGGPPLPQGQPGSGPSPIPRPRFALANQNNIIVLTDGPYRLGDRVPPDKLEQGIPLEIDGQQLGTILTNNTRTSRNPLEEQYLARTTQTVLIAAVGATIIALGVGIFLARTLTRSLRELTTATLAMATGNLAQKVPVRSQDELGQLAQAFNQMSAAVTRANQLRRQMTADIAHDLRTPLSVINGYLEAMRDGDLAPTPARLEAIYAEARQLNCLVTDLRTLSLADAGELKLNLQPCWPYTMLAHTVTAYQVQAGEKNITLTVKAGRDLPAVSADPDRMAQVLGNLVSNALRYTPVGGQITLSAGADNTKVSLQVQDTGSGIAAAELPHIFNRFYRVDTSRQQPHGESGLGLAIARSIVEAHGGSISAESIPNQGTTFTILLNLSSN